MERGSDVVVIGGEIVRSAIAYQLARRCVGVVLVERNEIAGEQSGRNWGFMRHWTESHRGWIGSVARGLGSRNSRRCHAARRGPRVF
jgi:glycine/D-amino acid oxidase-like deaminating enzyme